MKWGLTPSPKCARLAMVKLREGNMQPTKEALEFVRDAINRLRDADAVGRNDQEMLAEELDDIEHVVLAALETQRG